MEVATLQASSSFCVISQDIPQMESLLADYAKLLRTLEFIIYEPSYKPFQIRNTFMVVRCNFWAKTRKGVSVFSVNALIRDQGSVAWKPVSAYPGLNSNPGFFFLLSKALSFE